MERYAAGRMAARQCRGRCALVPDPRRISTRVKCGSPPAARLPGFARSRGEPWRRDLPRHRLSGGGRCVRGGTGNNILIDAAGELRALSIRSGSRTARAPCWRARRASSVPTLRSRARRGAQALGRSRLAAVRATRRHCLARPSHRVLRRPMTRRWRSRILSAGPGRSTACGAPGQARRRRAACRSRRHRRRLSKASSGSSHDPRGLQSGAPDPRDIEGRIHSANGNRNAHPASRTCGVLGCARATVSRRWASARRHAGAHRTARRKAGSFARIRRAFAVTVPPAD